MQEQLTVAPLGIAAGTTQLARPRRQLGVWHATAVCVGMVIGAGIFKTAPSVAANLMSSDALFYAWTIGGVLSIVGALCFAELAAAFPDAGGDYYFLLLAYGRPLAFLFAWSRFAVIHTGSMALLAFVFGDYLSQIIDLGPMTSPLFGVAAIVALCAINLRGVRFGVDTQVGLMLLVLFGLACVALGGAWYGLTGEPALTSFGLSHSPSDRTQFGEAMVFVFLAYGGWSDAATLSSEMRDARHGITRALLIGMTIVGVLYLSANWAYLRVLGLDGLAASEAPAADLMLHVFGPLGRALMVAIVSATSLSVMNAVLIAGARTTYAAARDEPGLQFIGRWDEKGGTPAHAVLAIGATALVLIGFGTLTRGRFETMVDYLTPVYWFFLTLSGASVMVLRRRMPDAQRPFRVPFYPFTPVLFCLSSLYVLYSTLAFTGIGALVGVAVLALGALLWAGLELRARMGR